MHCVVISIYIYFLLVLLIWRFLVFNFRFPHIIYLLLAIERCRSWTLTLHLWISNLKIPLIDPAPAFLGSPPRLLSLLDPDVPASLRCERCGSCPLSLISILWWYLFASPVDESLVRILTDLYILGDRWLDRREQMPDEDLIELKFRLYDGTDIGPIRYSASSTVAMLKERIISEWPRGRSSRFF